MTTKTTKTIEDKHNKKCEWCEESFYDNTRPKNKKTCSRKCGDELRKQRQREEYRKKNPPKPNLRQLNYNGNMEYPFWAGDERQFNDEYYRHHTGYDMADFERLEGQMQSRAIMGGRRKGKPVSLYDGDKKGSHNVTVKYTNHEHKKAGEVVTVKKTREEIDAYLSEKYGKK